MRRGEIHTAATGGGYGGKPRPVLIVQADQYCTSPRIVVALIASRTTNPPSTRLPIDPTTDNGLERPSEVQVDILVTVPWDKFGTCCGKLGEDDMRRVDRALLSLLGFASSSQ